MIRQITTLEVCQQGCSSNPARLRAGDSNAASRPAESTQCALTGMACAGGALQLSFKLRVNACVAAMKTLVSKACRCRYMGLWHPPWSSVTVAGDRPSGPRWHRPAVCKAPHLGRYLLAGWHPLCDVAILPSCPCYSPGTASTVCDEANHSISCTGCSNR